MPDRGTSSVAVVGAGSVGCYVGGLLASSGNEIVFCGRERQGVEIAQHGLTLQRLDGCVEKVDGASVSYVTSIDDLPAVDVVLICVKSDDSESVADVLSETVNASATVVSLQNGLDNASILFSRLPNTAVVPGMVAFNVVSSAFGHFACATEGAIYLGLGEHIPALSQSMNKSGIVTHVEEDMAAVQYAKLMLNLNNALNALSGLPLAEQLYRREWRNVMAACIDEGLTVAKAMGLKPARIGKVRPAIIPLVLRLPNFLFLRVASQMMKVDPAARTSMCDDLERGRRPEINHLNGKIVALGKKYSVPTPVNERVVAAVWDLFDGKRNPSADVSGLL